MDNKVYISKETITLTRFADGEIRPFIGRTVKGKDVVYVASMYPVPSDIILEWVLTIDAIKRKKATSVIAVVPYMPYMRQSKIHREGESCSAEVVGRILSSSGADSIITFDLHNESALSFFSVPITHLSTIFLLPSVVSVDKNTIVVSPDEGSAARAKEAADLLHIPLVVMQKKRSLVQGDSVEELELQNEVTGKTVIIVDDIISTGATIAKAVKLLKEKGATKIIVFAVHAVFAGNAKSLLEHAGIDELIVTDTIPKTKEELPKGTKIVSIQHLLEQALH